MPSSELRLTIRSVNVGLPKAIGLRAGVEVFSAIGKAPVETPTCALMPVGLEGDRQADPTVHGGPDKAVYAYPSDHWPAWADGHGLACAPATFGENLTVSGATEANVHIGDLFAWGEAILQVTQPRQPCYKLGLHLKRDDIGAAMVQSGRTGWYFRVTRTGTVPVHGATLVRIGHEAAGPSVLAIFRAYFDPKRPADELAAFAATPGLSEDWRQTLAARAAARRG